MSEKDREWFLEKRRQAAKKSGRVLLIQGREAYEQRVQREDQSTFSPQPQADQKSSCPSEPAKKTQRIKEI